MVSRGFNGLRVLSLEARRAAEVTKLITNQGGVATVVPSVREVPLEANPEVFAFAERLLAGDYDALVFTTGVGVRQMMEVLETRYTRAEIVAAMQRTRVVARSVKPQGPLRELGILPAAVAAEPSTWREVLAAMEAAFGATMSEMRVAVQEYGATNEEFAEGLRSRCATVDLVRVYRWELPEDREPLRGVVRKAVAREFDVVLLMSAVQVTHLFAVATEMGMADALRGALRQMVLCSIGPSTTEGLLPFGIVPDFEPTHPKMGFLVTEAAQRAEALMAAKRSSG